MSVTVLQARLVESGVVEDVVDLRDEVERVAGGTSTGSIIRRVTSCATGEAASSSASAIVQIPASIPIPTLNNVLMMSMAPGSERLTEA